MLWFDLANLSRELEQKPIVVHVSLKRDLFLLAFYYISKNIISRKAQIGKSISEIGLEGSYPSYAKDFLDGKKKNKCTPRNGGVFCFTKDGLLRAHLL